MFEQKHSLISLENIKKGEIYKNIFICGESRTFKVTKKSVNSCYAISYLIGRRLGNMELIDTIVGTLVGIAGTAGVTLLLEKKIQR